MYIVKIKIETYLKTHYFRCSYLKCSFNEYIFFIWHQIYTITIKLVRKINTFKIIDVLLDNDWFFDNIMFNIMIENIWRRYSCQWTGEQFRPILRTYGLKPRRGLHHAKSAVALMLYSDTFILIEIQNVHPYWSWQFSVFKENILEWCRSVGIWNKLILLVPFP